jgi:hypothetical protein
MSTNYYYYLMFEITHTLAFQTLRFLLWIHTLILQCQPTCSDLNDTTAACDSQTDVPSDVAINYGPNMLYYPNSALWHIPEMWSCFQFPGTATSAYVAIAFCNLEHYYYFIHESNLKKLFCIVTPPLKNGTHLQRVSQCTNYNYFYKRLK